MGKHIRIFLSENFHFLVVKFSVHFNRHVFVMTPVVFSFENRKEGNVETVHCSRIYVHCLIVSVGIPTV